MINIQVDEAFQASVDEHRINMAALAVLAHQDKGYECELTILITDDAELHRLNKEFLGIDKPTDVLSFPAGETNPETDQEYLGDISVSLTQAEKQARAGGHELIEELQLLVVHGCLHLLGFDHESPEDKSIMWSAQNEILETLSVTARPD
jgi:probable rRNA maturation factor